MAEINQFGSAGPNDQQICARCEALLLDVLDHTASAEDQAFFDLHLSTCVSCSRMYMDSKRGAAWLEMLRDPRPQPSPSLFDRILAQTTGAETGVDFPAAEATLSQTLGTQAIGHQFGSGSAIGALPHAAPKPALSPHNVLPFRPRGLVSSYTRRFVQPRLAMTAAMAFFSIALTLNLSGIHLSQLRAADLRPANLRRNFYQANAHIVRYYDNLRVVYELEARVRDLQRTADQETDPAPARKPDEKSDPQPAKKPGPGTSLRHPLFPDSRSLADLRVVFPPLQPQLPSKGDRS